MKWTFVARLLKLIYCISKKYGDKGFNEVVNYAKNSLVNIPYSAFSSSFTDSIRKTQCAHIVWYAYHKFDFELLKNDKLIVLPYDLASSEEVEVVQTFGFDPNVPWDSLYK